MRAFVFIITTLLMGTSCMAQGEFRDSQLRFPRVRQAYDETWERLEGWMISSQIGRETLEIYLVAYKQEKIVEVWARNRGEEQFRILKSYDICALSGGNGPKRRQGDGQIPEGFYHISIFNPSSQFHLSLGINYPNASDRVLSDRDHPGGDIFIHGSCVTIGCIPITDPKIKELYLLCVEARNNGQMKIPVTIYPARLGDENHRNLILAHQDDPDRLNLWSDLKTAFDLFQETRDLPTVTFLANGRHQIR
jgi:murein L,D-transpeptidase YafK